MLDKFTNKSLFVTGGTGFFGKSLLSYINELNKQLGLNLRLTVLSRNPEKFIKLFPELTRGQHLSFVKGDIRNFRLPEEMKYDYVIHGATDINNKQKEAPSGREIYSVIVDGAKHLLEELKRNNSETRLLFVSSGGVYGKQPVGLSHISEKFKCCPITAYGKGKLQAEQLFLESGIRTSIARCFTFVGPYVPLNAHFAIGNFILNGLKGEPIIIKGDGKVCRSYMYSEDLIEWLLKILTDGREMEVYNVGSEEAITIAELANLVSECFDNKLVVKVLGESIPGVSNRYIPSTQKAQNKLRLKLRTNLKTAILKTIDFYNANFDKIET